MPKEDDLTFVQKLRTQVDQHSLGRGEAVGKIEGRETDQIGVSSWFPMGNAIVTTA